MTPFNQLVPAPQNPLQSESLVPRGEARGRPIRDGGEKGENLCAIPQASPIYFLGYIERERGPIARTRLVFHMGI